MKILIGIDAQGETRNLSAYRMVDWPAAPRKEEDIYPFIMAPDVDKEVFYVGHYFERGYVVVNADPFELDYLLELLEPEKDFWVISTSENRVSEEKAAQILLSKMV